MRWAVTQAYIDIDGPHCDTKIVEADSWFNALAAFEGDLADDWKEEWSGLEFLSLDQAKALFYDSCEFLFNCEVIEDKVAH